MAKVVGVGGIFFKSPNPKQLGQWYQQWLGIPIDETWGGCSFFAKDMPEKGYTVFAPFKQDTQYFAPSSQPFMINLIVDDLHSALAQVVKGGATLAGEPEEHDYGHFGWFIDPDGNKIELWQPK